MTLAILELESSSLAPLDSCQKQNIGKVMLSDTFVRTYLLNRRVRCDWRWRCRQRVRADGLVKGTSHDTRHCIEPSASRFLPEANLHRRGHANDTFVRTYLFGRRLRCDWRWRCRQGVRADGLAGARAHRGFKVCHCRSCRAQALGYIRAHVVTELGYIRLTLLPNWAVRLTKLTQTILTFISYT